MKLPIIQHVHFHRFLCTLLAVLMAIGPSSNVLAQNAAAQAVRQRAQGLAGDSVGAEVDTERRVSNDKTLVADAAAGVIDTAYVTESAVALVVLRPAQIMVSPLAELLPTEVATAAGLKYLGFDPADVDEVVAFVENPNPAAPPGFGLTVKFNKPFKASAIPQQLRAHAQVAELNGKKYLQSQHPMLPSFYGPNNQTLIVAPEATLQQLLGSTGGKSGPIIDRIRSVPAGSDLYVALDVASLRPLIQLGLAQAQTNIPPDAQPFLQAPGLITAAELTLNLSKPGPTSLLVHANDEPAAQQLETMMVDASNKYQAQMKAQMAQQAASDDPIEQAMARYVERVSGRWAQPLMPQREGAQLVFFKSDGDPSKQQQLTQVAIIGVLVALLLPAVQAAREAARRSSSMNNLKMMVLALMNYHDTKGSFPAHAIYSDDGKPLLSWRVAILPFIEQQALYEQFHLNEPWDSEHNRALIAQMPEVYACPNIAEPGKTNYLAVIGPDCAFNGTKDGLRFQDFTDGTSKTIVIVEADADQAVEWTKPDDLEFNADNPNAGLGNLRPGGFNALFCDGHAQFISNGIDPNLLKALFTRAGGEAVELP